MIWRWYILLKSYLTDFYKSYGLLAIFQQYVLSLHQLPYSSCSFQWILVDVSETFQLLFPWPEEDHNYTEVMLDCFLSEFWFFVSFSHFINRCSCLHNSSYISQGILMKLPCYCFHGLKLIIFYWGQAWLIFTMRFVCPCHMATNICKINKSS